MIAINDPAGTAILFTKAINQYTEHTCRLITKEIRYNFMFEKDLHLPWLNKNDWDEVEELLITSEIFHFHMTADENTKLGPFRPVDFIKNKLIIHHHHGHPDFRNNPEKYRQKYKRLNRNNLLVSTPDLLKLLPEATWQPNLIPINDPLYLPIENKAKEPIIIAHSPTRRELKDTNVFIKAINKLSHNSKVPIEFRLIENTLHKECLRLKRESHILFDHLQGYFGVSSLEGLSQGLCAVAALDEWNMNNIKAFTGSTKLPWFLTSVNKLEEDLKRLFYDKNLLNLHARQSRKFMETFWNKNKIIQHLILNYT
jgi:hypothetical protein